LAPTIAWNQGGGASIEQLDGERIELSSTRAFAPGSRPEGTLIIGEASFPFWMKVHGSRRQDDGSYRISGRLLNVTRDVRQRLKEAVLTQNGGKRTIS
jgi:hypothetical protein